MCCLQPKRTSSRAPRRVQGQDPGNSDTGWLPFNLSPVYGLALKPSDDRDSLPAGRPLAIARGLIGPLNRTPRRIEPRRVPFRFLLDTDAWTRPSFARSATTRLPLPSLDALFTNDRNHDERSYGSGPPQIEECIEREAKQQNCRKIHSKF